MMGCYVKIVSGNVGYVWLSIPRSCVWLFAPVAVTRLRSKCSTRSMCAPPVEGMEEMNPGGR